MRDDKRKENTVSTKITGGPLNILFVGDIHLGRQPSYLTPATWRSHVTDMLDAALTNALRLQVHHLIILGDVFDNNHPHPQDHAEFTDWLFRAKESGMSVIIIPGNHDYGNAEYTALEPYTRMRNTVKIIKQATTITLNGVPVKFFPWTPPDAPNKIGDIKGKTPYLIIHHEEVKGAKMDNGWLADGFTPRAKDFLVGGHLHTYQLVGKLQRVLYVGTALVSHWNHAVQGFTLLTAKLVNGKLIVDHEQVPYTPPFLLKELSLKAFLKLRRQKDKIRTYYRVIAPTGKDLPDDKRIVSRKFVGGDKKKETSRTKTSSITNLPSPMSWLIGRLPKEQRKQAMKVLSSVITVEE